MIAVDVENWLLEEVVADVAELGKWKTVNALGCKRKERQAVRLAPRQWALVKLLDAML